MKIKFSVGEYIWFMSILLYLIWAVIGLNYKISPEHIAIYGSIGMVVFVLLGNILRFLKWQNVNIKRLR